jgi:hypothetical protein
MNFISVAMKVESVLKTAPTLSSNKKLMAKSNNKGAILWGYNALGI